MTKRTCMTGFFLAVVIVSTAWSQDIQLSCNCDQKEYVAGAVIPLKLSVTRKDAGEPLTFLVHFMADSLGNLSCFKVRCWGPDGKELPLQLRNPQEGMKQHIRKYTLTGGSEFSETIDLLTWFHPPIGGPYKVKAFYEWTDDVEKYAPHWKGRTNAAACEFSVRGVDYGALDEASRTKLNNLLNKLRDSRKRPAAIQELAAMGRPALPAFHDSLQLADLNIRKGLLRVLAAIKAPESLPVILNCPLMLRGNMIPQDVQKARDDALCAYGEAALPLLETAATKDETLKPAIVRIKAEAKPQEERTP